MEFDKNKSKEELIKEFSLLEFQWIKGENVGLIEKFNDILDEGDDFRFVIFESGNRVNINLLSEFMEAFPVSNNLDLDGLPKNIKKVQGNKKTEVNSIDYSASSNSFSNPVDMNSPIYGLLSKQKPNMVDVNISIKINLPPKDLYSVLTSSFDGAEEEIVNYVISSLNIEDIKESLSNSILNSYYKSKGIHKKNNEEKTEA